MYDMSNVQELIEELAQLYEDAKNPVCPGFEESELTVETVRDAKYYLEGYFVGYYKAAYQTLRLLILHGFYDPDEKKVNSDG